MNHPHATLFALMKFGDKTNGVPSDGREKASIFCDDCKIKRNICRSGEVSILRMSNE